ncbi:MAG: copper-binding protein [Rhizobiaceae bacterium]|uniref:cupredoxin domain-containing protein n=1 Tax=Albidovulum sp. TaxID=1872424 RepID=UPI0013A906F9|nr:MAG: copper-binding protein [Rhizobiaceae bacterium]CAG1013459.1 plastocyanin [Rhizobiaceae bacterium]
MRGLTPLTRRGFGRGLGAALSLAGLPVIARAHSGTHEVEVRMASFAFDPASVEVLVGDSITWTNADLAPHTATAEDGTWDTGTLERGGRGRITFDAPGDYSYFCAYHPHMKGTVTVRTRSGA